MKGTITGNQELHSSILSARGREGTVRLGTLGYKKLESSIRNLKIGWGTDGKESLPHSQFPFTSKYCS